MRLTRYDIKLGWSFSYSVIDWLGPRLGLLEGVCRALTVLVRAWSVANVLVFLDLCDVDDLAGVEGGVRSLTFIKGVALTEPSLLHVPCRLSPLSLLRVVTLLPLSTPAMLG